MRAHRTFLNGYYGISRHFYDLTRKYYLLGRDRELDALCSEDWESLVEVGPGTGRNLRWLHGRRASAFYGGIEASDAMLGHARTRCPFARIEHGFAESCDVAERCGRHPDRILFSYCLSMVQHPRRAIENCLEALSDEGELVVVDFGDLNGLPHPLQVVLRRWLTAFHVRPVTLDDLDDWGRAARSRRISWGPGRYFVQARFVP